MTQRGSMAVALLLAGVMTACTGGASTSDNTSRLNQSHVTNGDAPHGARDHSKMPADMPGMPMGGDTHDRAVPDVVEFKPHKGDLETAGFEDLNADPGILEVNLTAKAGETEYLPGKKSKVWMFNGSVPGPTLEAKVGDLIIVHFKNELPEETTIHWHGVRVPNAIDGTMATMSPVQPGRSFEYRFYAVDAGLFWYHPHIRSDLQNHLGLYGAILIHEPKEPAIAATGDHVIVLSDVNLNSETGETRDENNMMTQMMGREGNVVLVNGKPSNVAITATAGQAHRFRIVVPLTEILAWIIE